MGDLRVLVEARTEGEGFHLTEHLTTYEIRLVRWEIDAGDCTVYAAKVSLNGCVAANSKPFLDYSLSALPVELRDRLLEAKKAL
jgi:hypothetical protein